jgi:hypothetical protein
VHSENTRHTVDALIQIVKAAYKYPAVVNPYFRMKTADSIPDLPDQGTDKIWPVQAFQKDFSVTDQQ